MKSISVICFTLLLSAGNVFGVEKIEPIILEPIKIEAIKVQTECPQDSKFAGETVPEWVVGEESIEYFCNSDGDELEEAE